MLGDPGKAGRDQAAPGRALLDLASDRAPPSEDMPGLRRAMRALLLEHLGGRGLKSWELIAALPRAATPASAGAPSMPRTDHATDPDKD